MRACIDIIYIYIYIMYYIYIIYIFFCSSIFIRCRDIYIYGTLVALYTSHRAPYQTIRVNFLSGGNLNHGHGIPRREIIRDLIAFEDILLIRGIRSFLERGESRESGLRVFSQAIQIERFELCL